MMMRFSVFLLFLLTLTTQACSQVPADRPAIENAEFDERLSRLLSFDAPLIGVEEVYKNADRYLLLDARERIEFETSHLPNARFLGYKDLNTDLLKHLDRKQSIVVYCSVGYRSEKITRQLQDMGFEKVYNLYGSIFEWANRSYPLVDAAGLPTREVHTYNKRWSKWVDAPDIKKVW